MGPGFGTHICDVEVDPDTGRVQVVRYTAVQDVGKAVHPSYVEGQMQGGAAQGIGAAYARALAREGAHVVVTDILDPAPLAEEITATGREALDEIPGEVFVFRATPVARKVLKMLEEHRSAEG